jgi:hypothetical protein
MNANIARADTRTKKVSKLRIAATGVLGATVLSIVASLAPAVASADRYQPNTRWRHPAAQYFGNLEYPGWAINTPHQDRSPLTSQPTN